MREMRERKTVEGFFQGERKQKTSLLRVVIFPVKCKCLAILLQ